MSKKKTIGFIGGKFLPLHNGHVYAIKFASKHVDELYVVLSSSKRRDKELCQRDGISYIPPDVRLSWLGKEFAKTKNIKIVHVEDNYGERDYDWEKGSKLIKDAIGKKIDYVFSSEEEYTPII